MVSVFAARPMHHCSGRPWARGIVPPGGRPMPPRLYYDVKNPGRVTIDRPFYRRLGETTRRSLVEKMIVPIRTGRAWPVRKGQLCRIVAIEGPQVCDFNAWNLHNPRERF